VLHLIYKGYREIDLTEGELAQLYENVDKNLYELHTNEYLIVKLNKEVKDKLRWDGERLVKIKHYKWKSTEILKPLDDIQFCAYDALLNNNIKVICLIGKSGTGKTKTAISIGLELLKIGTYDKIIFIRHAEEAGKSIGFFPGTKTDKLESFAGCVYDNLNGQKFEFEELVRTERIEVESLGLLKGRNFKNMIVIFDECEDAFPDHIELVGTRINDSCKLIFVGDYDQVSNPKYGKNSGLLKLIDRAKGKEWFACVELKTNGRGKVAEFFATEFKKELNML
jgi:predicted ribonuclease YlaK